MAMMCRFPAFWKMVQQATLVGIRKILWNNGIMEEKRYLLSRSAHLLR